MHPEFLVVTWLLLVIYLKGSYIGGIDVDFASSPIQ